MVHFGEFLKTRSLQSKSVTSRQTSVCKWVCFVYLFYLIHTRIIVILLVVKQNVFSRTEAEF